MSQGEAQVSARWLNVEPVEESPSVEGAVNGIRNIKRKLSDIVLRERRRVVDMWKRVSTGVWEVELPGCLINSCVGARRTMIA